MPGPCWPVIAYGSSEKDWCFCAYLGFSGSGSSARNGGHLSDRDTLWRTRAASRVSRAGSLGHRAEAACLAAGSPGQLLQHPSQGLPCGRYARRRQDHLRAAGGLHADRGQRRQPRHHRGAHGPPEAAVGRRRRQGGHRHRSELQERRRPARPRLHRRRGHLRAGGEQADAAPGQDRGRPHAGHPRRNPPRRRGAVVGRRAPRSLRARGAPALADRYAVPFRHLAHPVRGIRRGPGRDPAVQGGLHLRLRQGAPGPRGPSRDVHGLLRPDALAHQRRRGDGGLARRSRRSPRTSPPRPGGPR